MIPYGRQEITQADIDAVVEVLRSDFLTQGPAVPRFEAALAARVGAPHAVAANSATSALHLACMALDLAPGDLLWTVPNTFVASANCGRYCGADVDFVDIDPVSWNISIPALYEKLLQARHESRLPKVLVAVHFAGQPADMTRLMAIAKKHKLILLIDNTFATPYLFRPFEWGAHVITHSTTKFITGNGTSIGGIIVDGGNYDWSNGKFENFNTPDPSYHGLVYSSIAAAGLPPFAIKARVQVLRDIGACQSPFNSWQTLLGLETLNLRMDRHVQNAQAVAEYLENHPKVSWVKYPGLKSHPDYEGARKYLPKGAGAILGFGINGDVEAGKKFIESLQLFSHLANVGDARSLAIHPATTTHSQLNSEDLIAAGVSPDFIRLSIGLEDFEDIKWDLDQALNA